MRKTFLIALLSTTLASPLSVFAEDLHHHHHEAEDSNKHDMNKNSDGVTSIEYNEQKFQNKVVFSTNDYEVILFAFTKNQGLNEHSSPFDAFLQVIEGESLLNMDGKDYHLKAGEGIKLNMNKLHTLKAKTNFKMLLIKQKSKSLK